MKRPKLLPEQEVKWNERARMFVETFQKVMGVGPMTDSLAGLSTFATLRGLDTYNRLSDEEWQALLRSVR